jgi:hypothetical protein
VLQSKSYQQILDKHYKILHVVKIIVISWRVCHFEKG